MNIRVADGNIRVFESKSILFPGNWSFSLFDSIEKKENSMELSNTIEYRVNVYRFSICLGSFCWFNVCHYFLINALASPNSIRIDIWALTTLDEPSLKITTKCVSNEIIEICFIPYRLVVRLSFIHASLTITRFPLFKLQAFYEPQLWNHDSTRLLRVLIERKTIW